MPTLHASDNAYSDSERREINRSLVYGKFQ